MLGSGLDTDGFNYLEEKVICRDLFSVCIFTRRGIFNQNNISFGFFSYKKEILSCFFFLTVLHLDIKKSIATEKTCIFLMWSTDCCNFYILISNLLILSPLLLLLSRFSPVRLCATP